MFYCPYCIVKTKLKSAYEYLKHLDSHNPTKKKNYPCPVCTIPFKCKSEFYKHMQSHEKPVPESQEILCRHCDTLFPSITEVEKHLEKLAPRILCPFCKAKPFKIMNSYRVHKHRLVLKIIYDHLI